MSASSTEPSVEVATEKSHVKRPPNVWLIYRISKMREYFEAHPGEKHDLSQMSKTIAHQWRNEPDEVVRHFERLAKEKKMEHLALNPGYKYRPRPRGLDGKQQPKKAKRGTVTKPRRTKKVKVASTSTVVLAPTQTNVHTSIGEWPEAYNVAAAPSDVVGLISAVAPCHQYPVHDGIELGSMVSPVDQYIFADNGVTLGSALAPALNDQHVVASGNVDALSPAMASSDHYAMANADYTFYDNPISSPDTFDMMMLNNEAQPLDYYGQPSQPCMSCTANQPFSASQVYDYQSAELSGQIQGGDTVAYRGLLHADSGLYQPSNTYEVNDLYGQTTEFDASAELNGAYPIPYSQNDAGSGYAEYNTGFTNADAAGYDHTFIDTTFNTNGVQAPAAVWNNFADIMAIEQPTWATIVAAVAASYADA